MSLPLKGIRIIDFSWMLAGPYATRILADYGAEVIKVQTTLISNGMEQNDSYPFATINRNKLGITLNMDSSEARELALKLIAISDVVIQNFSPRVLENWSLTYNDIKKVNPSIIMISLSGFGNSGPWKDYAALADTVEALSGITSLSASDSDYPCMIAYPYADIVSGMFAGIGILSALEQRRITGRGKYIDVSELETMCTVLGPIFTGYLMNNKSMVSEACDIDAGLDGCYKCKGTDRWIVISLQNEQQWRDFCNIMDTPDWTKKPGYSTLSQCRQRQSRVFYYIEQWTQSRDVKEIVRLLRKARIPCNKVNDARDIALDLQLKHRNYFQSVSDPNRGQIIMDSTPIRLSRTGATIRKNAPLLGEDNDYVFQSLLDMDRITINGLKKKKVIY